MVATTFLAAFLLSSQAQKPSIDEKIRSLSSDLRQSLTLLDSLKAKVTNQNEAVKLITQFSDKMEAIGSTAETYMALAKTDDDKVRLSIIRFEALANSLRPPEQIEGIANDILAKYKDSAALCLAIEDLTFFQYLTLDRYSTFDTMLKQSKNPEVLASSILAGIFIQFMTEEGDLNKLQVLSIKYKDTKAGQRAAKVFEIRTKLVLGQPMIDLDLNLLGGNKVSVSSLRGKVVVLNFWGFWNPPSMSELPEIKDYIFKYPTKLTWVGINTDNWTSAFVSQRIKESGMTWPNVAAGSPTGRLPMDFGIVNYPSKIIIDAVGIVRYVPSIRDWRPVLEDVLSKT